MSELLRKLHGEGEKFNSFLETFTQDGENVVTDFLSHYMATFTKGMVGGKIAEGIVTSAVLPELKVPLAAISALISSGWEIFKESQVDDFKVGDICLYHNGYWPETNREEQALNSMFQDDDLFESEELVSRYDVCVIRERTSDSHYMVFDLADQELKKVHYQKLRHERKAEISRFKPIKDLVMKYVFPRKRTFVVGDAVQVKLPTQTQFIGIVEEVTKTFLYVQDTFNQTEVKIPKQNWQYIVKEDVIEGSGKHFESVKTSLNEKDICFFNLDGFERPCVIVTINKLVATIRYFHIDGIHRVPTSSLKKASRTFINHMYSTGAYRRVVDMISGGHEEPGMTAQPPSATFGGFPGQRRGDRKTDGGESDEEGSVEWAAEGDTIEGRPTPGFDIGTGSEQDEAKTNVNTYLLVAAVVLGGVLIVYK